MSIRPIDSAAPSADPGSTPAIRAAAAIGPRSPSSLAAASRRAVRAAAGRFSSRAWYAVTSLVPTGSGSGSGS